MAKRLASAGRKVTARRGTGRKGQAWGNALGGYKSQRRVGGKFASSSGGAKVGSAVAATAKPKARASRAKAYRSAAIALAIAGAGVGGAALAGTALAVPLPPPLYRPEYLTAEQAKRHLSRPTGRKITR